MFILGVIRALTELARYNIFPIYNIYFLTALQFMHDLIYISWPYFVKKKKRNWTGDWCFVCFASRMNPEQKGYDLT